MAKHDLSLLGALIATQNLSFDDAKAITEFCDHVDVQCIAPVNLETAVDLALDFFNEDPDKEAARVAAEVAEHNAHEGHCCECGVALDEDEIITELDVEMAVDFWVQARSMVRLRDEIVTDDSRDEC